MCSSVDWSKLLQVTGNIWNENLNVIVKIIPRVFRTIKKKVNFSRLLFDWIHKRVIPIISGKLIVFTKFYHLLVCGYSFVIA